MNNKFNVCLVVLQLTVGILGMIVFVRSILNYGEVSITMTVLSLILTVSGLKLGIKGLYDMMKH